MLREALTDITRHRMTMQLLIGVSLLTAISTGQVFTALIILLCVLGAQTVENAVISKGRHTIRCHADGLSRNVELRSDGDLRKAALSEVLIGDEVLIRPGRCIPINGEVVAGHSLVDESILTGEPAVAEKRSGTCVYAGTFNKSGTLEIRTTSPAGDAVYSGSLDNIEQMKKSSAAVQRTVDRLETYFVCAALGAATLTFITTSNPRAALSVMIVVGACGVTKGSPLAILGAIGQARRKGVLVNNDSCLEQLARINTAALDRISTGNMGRMEVIGCQPAEGVRFENLLSVAASAELFSEDPSAAAITRQAKELHLPVLAPSESQYRRGRGLKCKVSGKSTLVGTRCLLTEYGIAVSSPETCLSGITEEFVAQEGRFLGIICLAEVMRSEARDAVHALKAMRVETVLFSEDLEPVAGAIADALGVDRVEFELFPEDKQHKIAALRSAGRRVAMIGDEIKDISALRKASVGIGMVLDTSLPLGQQSANIVSMLGNNLQTFVSTLRIARRARCIILTNFVGTILVDAVGIALAITGILNPVGAVAVHVGSELAFIVNSARLLPSVAK
ncbi:MAG TPA: HAD-IC family P-type ATPase [Bryobacteraceae bacterium]|nr:HAD-IC family P-type ATPase [Bryobacteraceae bacterium]